MTPMRPSAGAPPALAGGERRDATLGPPTGSGAVDWEGLFARFFSGEPGEAADAVATFARMIRFWMLRLGVRDSDLSSDDLVQDVLLELTRSRACIHDPTALGGWLRTTTTHKIRDRWRSRRRTPAWLHDVELDSVPAPTLLPDEQVLEKQDRSDLRHAIDRLPSVLRQCIELQLRGLSEAAIARELSDPDASHTVPIHSVKNWLRKARSVLKHSLLEMRP